MREYQLHEFVRFPEDREHETKAVQMGQDPVKAIAEKMEEYIDAFLNTAGGIIYFGIEDDGRVMGVRLTRSDGDDLRRRLDQKMSLFHPSVDPELYRLHFIPVHGQGVGQDIWVVEIHVSKGPASLYWIGSQRAWIRRDGSNFSMPPDMIEERIQRGRTPAVDSAPRSLGGLAERPRRVSHMGSTRLQSVLAAYEEVAPAEPAIRLRRRSYAQIYPLSWPNNDHLRIHYEFLEEGLVIGIEIHLEPKTRWPAAMVELFRRFKQELANTGEIVVFNDTDLKYGGWRLAILFDQTHTARDIAKAMVSLIGRTQARITVVLNQLNLSEPMP